MDSLKYWLVVTTTPDLSLFVDKNRVEDFKLVEVKEILLSCHPRVYLCKGTVSCSCFLKYYYYFSKSKHGHQAKVFTFMIYLKREHKTFPLKQLPQSVTTRCYAVHNFPKQIKKEQYVNSGTKSVIITVEDRV